MATARETINTGLEALRVIGFGRSPTSAMAQYCLGKLNAYIRQLAGFGASLPLQPVTVTGSYEVRTRWPALRLHCTDGATITLPSTDCEIPDGMRVEVIDAAENAATANITIAGNGRLIGGASSYTLDADGETVMLMFRHDLGQWSVVATLGLDDPLPFPDDFDEAIALNAAKRYTRFGQRLSAADEELAKAGARRLRARYAKPPPAQFDAAVSSIGGENRVVTGSLVHFLNGLD